MTKEMYAADVKNWLMDLATGAQASQRKIQFASESNKNRNWRVTSSCYNSRKEVAIHNLKNLAEAIDIPVKFRWFAKGEYLYGEYDGYYYFEMFGVRFYDLANIEEENS